MTGTMSPEETLTPETTETVTETVEPVVTDSVTDTLGTPPPTDAITPVITATAESLLPTVEATLTITTALPAEETPSVSTTETMTATVEPSGAGLPSVEISPTVGGPGSLVQVSLTGFPASEVAVVQMGVINAAPSVRRAAEIDANGGLTTTLTIPQVALRGEQWIVFAFIEDGRTFASSRVFRVQ
jgi:hypothetical protein